MITPRAPIRAWRAVRGHGQLHRPARRPRRRRRHDRGLVPVDATPGDEGASSPPSRSAPRTGCRSTTTRARSRRYDFYDTVHARQDGDRQRRAGLAAANHRRTRNFPGGSTTLALALAEGIAALPGREQRRLLRPDRAARQRTASSYYEAQDTRDRAARRPQPTRRSWTSRRTSSTSRAMFNGPFPFTTDGVVIGVPSASFEEEMQTKITFAGGAIDLGHVQPREHAPVVGRQRLRGELQPDLLQGGLGDARRVPLRGAQRPGRRRRPGHAGRRRRVRARAWSTASTTTYANTGSLWTGAPSNPTPVHAVRRLDHLHPPGHRVHRAATDPRPGPTSPRRCSSIQRDYRQSSITEPQLEAEFAAFLPEALAGLQCRARQFFTQWFDTAYPTGGGAQQAADHRSGLDGGGFQCGR